MSELVNLFWISNLYRSLKKLGQKCNFISWLGVKFIESKFVESLEEDILCEKLVVEDIENFFFFFIKCILYCDNENKLYNYSVCLLLINYCKFIYEYEIIYLPNQYYQSTKGLAL